MGFSRHPFCWRGWQKVLRGSQAPRRAVCGTRGSLRTMHGGGSAPSCCAFTHRVAFEEGSCRDHEGRRSSNEVVPGASVFLSSETGMSGNFEIASRVPSTVSQEQTQTWSIDFRKRTDTFQWERKARKLERMMFTSGK